MAEVREPQSPAKENNGSALRVDPPHALAASVEAAPAPDEAELALAAAGIVPAGGDALLTQAQQLAAALRERQRQLDLGETELNHKMARFDHEQRTARLWIREKELEVTERLEAAERLEATAQAKLAGISATEMTSESDLASRQSELERQQRDVQRQGDLLARRRENLDERAQELDSLQHQVLLEQERVMEKCQREEQRILAEREASQRSFREAEALLGAHLTQLEQDRKALADERLLLHEEMRGERLALAHRQQELENQYREKQVELSRHSETIEQRRAALDDLHAEVGRLHRESLEMRLIIEQLWQQLCRQSPPAELTRGVARLRGQIAEHYRAAEEQQAQQKSELVTLAAGLDEQQKQLRQRRRELEEWNTRRNHEIEDQAARLVAREQDLEKQEASHREAAAAWQRERQQLQNQVRRLSVRVTPSSVAA